MDLGELIWEDQSTMERVTKIVMAIWDKTITFKNEGESGEITCHIGWDWLCFYDGDLNAGELTPENIRENVGIFELAQMILASIINLDDNRYEDWCNVLGF